MNVAKLKFNYNFCTSAAYSWFKAANVKPPLSFSNGFKIVQII